MSIVNMIEFEKYIRSMEALVSRIASHNRIFSTQILEIEAEGWRDDVYKDTRNRLFRLQVSTNRFIDKLEETDLYLVELYRNGYEGYLKKEYNHISVEMERVDIIPDANLSDDRVIYASTEIISFFIKTTSAYIDKIHSEMAEFNIYHSRFADAFQTPRYEDLSIELAKVQLEIDQILNDMSFLVGVAKDLIDPMARFE